MKKSCIDMGGQAVIEGVMMKSKNNYSIAVRDPKGKIQVKSEKFRSIMQKYKILGLPFVRGMVSLIEMIILGMKSITYSANIAGDDEEDMSGFSIFISIVLAFGLAIFLFKYIPLLITQYLNSKIVSDSSLLFSLVDGVIKVAIFIGYILVISLWDEMRTVFRYHGAEHMAVHCYEAGKKLTVKNVSQFSPLHKRCGTCFILIVLILSILVYALIPNTIGFWMKLLLRLLLLPVIAGISYELLKAGAKYDNILLNMVTAPGIWFQRLTTRRPDSKQIEVAIKALKAVLVKEHGSR